MTREEIVNVVAEFFTGPHVVHSSISLQVGGHQSAMAKLFFDARKKLGIDGYATKEEAVATLAPERTRAETSTLKTVVVDYTNWRGERRSRTIEPTGRLVHESNAFHREAQWLLEAVDVDSGEVRLFAMRDVHSWRPESRVDKGRMEG